ncbi:hypothetical protein DES53_103199 [Roseimicrobium gellanilyticum]|uniref:Uncharacterized protein n=1 Tax=Roseimicrobium gellanilyticum TaxID=748857 RepID=A0A366HPA9_9BACT|nr:hypothetical protein DES53_103199 [Roseimicrobium gellanilyticum]
MRRILISSESYQFLELGGSRSKPYPTKDIGNGKAETMLGQMRVEFSKQTATGTKMRWELFSREDPERWEGVRVK